MIRQKLPINRHQIGRFGDGMEFETRATKFCMLRVYKVGRSFLIELLHSELLRDQVRLSNDQNIRRAYEQLAKLDVEYKEGGVVYSCTPGEHDDLGISLAMLAWAASHPHLEYWARGLETGRRRRPSSPQFGWPAFT
jgi:hypothetical protein